MTVMVKNNDNSGGFDEWKVHGESKTNLIALFFIKSFVINLPSQPFLGFPVLGWYTFRKVLTVVDCRVETNICGLTFHSQP